MKKICLFLLATISTFTASAQLPSYVPTSGLLAWYPFTDNPNDSSGYGNNGVEHGAVSYGTDRFGHANSCFVDNSLAAVDFPVNNFPLGNATRTVSVFFKLNTPYAGGFRELFAWGDNYAGGDRFGLEVVDDTVVGFESAGVGVLSTFIPDTLWHNLTVTYPTGGVGSSSIKLFIDGESAPVTTTVSPVSALTTTSGDIHCAGSLFLDPSFLYGFFGSLDDIGVWDHELTPCEIETMYHGPHSLTPVISSSGDTLRIPGTYTSYQWMKNDTAISGATSNTYTATTRGSYQVTVTTNGGCIDTSAIARSSLSINDLAAENSISIYPNPSKGIFNIRSTTSVNITLTGMDGRIIEQRNNAKQVDLSYLPDGSYFISVFDQSGSKIKTEKIDLLKN